MKKISPKRAVPLLLAAAALIYVGVMAHAYFNQRDMLYFPDKAMKSPEQYGLPMAAFDTKAEDGVKLALWYRPATPDRPTLVFFHGNSDNLGSRVKKFQTFIDSEYGVLAVSYRGFGTSEGSPSEDGIYMDARAAIRWLESKGVPQKDMILYGESLGTAVAVQMATEFKSVKAVVLESPFSSMVSVGKVHHPFLPVSLLLKDRFDSIAKIKDVQAPVLVVHGQADAVVPVQEGEALFNAANEPKKGAFLPGFGHSNVATKAIMVYLNFLILENIVAGEKATPAGGGVTVISQEKQNALKKKMEALKPQGGTPQAPLTP